MSKTTRRVATAVSALLLLSSVATAGPVKAAPPVLPNSMAVIGDSISAASIPDWNNPSPNNPEHSWSTGYESRDGVSSHYERILRKNGNIRNKNFNDAWPGAWSADGPAQAGAAVSQGVQYVTILLGPNDFCASSIDVMTPVADYEANFRTTLDTLSAGLPNVKILLASNPDVYKLWQLGHSDWWVSYVWRTFSICQSMFSESNTEADRQFVRQRIVDYNTVLQALCSQYTQCRYDGGAVFNYQFGWSDLSPVDYFHPSLAGQNTIAQVTWAAGYWPSV